MLDRDAYWEVTVSLNGERVVMIGRDELAGRELSEQDEDAIREAAIHLLAFIGDQPATHENP